MKLEYYNYSNDEILILNNENISLIEAVYKAYEMLEGEVIIYDSMPFLVINGHFVARVTNDVIESQKVSSLEIKHNKIYAYIKKGLG